MGKRKSKSPAEGQFTVDHTKSDVAEVPSVSRLLNRKRLTVSKVYAGNQEKTKNTETESTQKAIPTPTLEPKPEDKPQVAPVAVTQEETSDGVALSEDPSFSLTGIATAQYEPTASRTATKGTKTTQNTARSERTRTETAVPTDSIPNPPKIQTARRKKRTAASQLITWNLPDLQKGVDPMGKALAILFQKGAISAVFLAVKPPADGKTVPTFESTAAINPGNKQGVWTGLKWDPVVVPEMWNHLLKNTYVELSPPGTKTNMQSSRNVIRAAFGAHHPEWLLMFLVGPTNGCRGVLAIVSTRSLSADLSQVLPLISSLPPEEKKKAS